MDINDIIGLVKDTLENNSADKLNSVLNDFVDDIANANITGKKSKINEVMWASADVVEDIYDLSGKLHEENVFEIFASISSSIVVGDNLGEMKIEDCVYLEYKIKVQGEVNMNSNGTYGVAIDEITILNQILDTEACSNTSLEKHF